MIHIFDLLARAVPLNLARSRSAAHEVSQTSNSAQTMPATNFIVPPKRQGKRGKEGNKEGDQTEMLLAQKETEVDGEVNRGALVSSVLKALASSMPVPGAAHCRHRRVFSRRCQPRQASACPTDRGRLRGTPAGRPAALEEFAFSVSCRLQISPVSSTGQVASDFAHATDLEVAPENLP